MDHLLHTLQCVHLELLTCNEYKYSNFRETRLLASLCNDPLAQVLSFSRARPGFTVSAVSKKARVYAALLQDWSYLQEDLSLTFDCGMPKMLLPIDVSRNTLRYVEDLSHSRYSIQTTLSVMHWWLAQSTLPFETRGSAAVQAVLSAPPEISQRWKAVQLENLDLSVAVPPVRGQQLEEIHVHDKHRVFRDVVLADMTNLRILSVAKCTASTLRLIQQLPRLTSLCLREAQVNVLDMREFSCTAYLESLTLTNSAVLRLSGFAQCTALLHLNVSDTTFLQDLRPLASAPALQAIQACAGAVSDIRGLNECPALVFVNFSHCQRLLSLAPLAGAPMLRKIKASHSAVCTVSGLNKCGALEVVDVRGYKRLHTLEPLVGAPRLREVHVADAPTAAWRRIPPSLLRL